VANVSFAMFCCFYTHWFSYSLDHGIKTTVSDIWFVYVNLTSGRQIFCTNPLPGAYDFSH